MMKLIMFYKNQKNQMRNLNIDYLKEKTNIEDRNEVKIDKELNKQIFLLNEHNSCSFDSFIYIYIFFKSNIK